MFAKAAKKCNSYAKALYYTEKDFLQQEPGTLVELLRINNILQQPKAALGVLKYAQMNPSTHNAPEDSWSVSLCTIDTLYPCAGRPVFSSASIDTYWVFKQAFPKAKIE